MHYVVIAVGDDTLEAKAVEGANAALMQAVDYRHKGFEDVRFTDGYRFIAETVMESMTDASRS